MHATWKLRESVSREHLQEYPEIHPAVVQLLFNRGIRTQQDIERFLTPDYITDTHDPFLFRDMEKAVERIIQAGEKKERVVIYGDYDADGVCASAILSECLLKAGISAHVHLPHREKEGYGINMPAVKEFIKQGFQLLISCDCGITSVDEIAEMKKAGIDVIVTDHHLEPESIPDAFAILNPSCTNEPYPYKHLVGTGVAFKFAQALYARLRQRGASLVDGEEKWFLDLVAIATIADYGPLIDENRVFTKYGLLVLEKTRRQGLINLLQFMNGSAKHLTAEIVAYQLVPRLNAASRMDHANLAYQLLIEKDPVQAFAFAEELNRLNQERQKVSDKMFQEGKKQIATQHEERILIVVGEGWSAGIVGLVAGKLLHTYGKPVLVIGKNEDEIVGSGRSIPAFDVTAALRLASTCLRKFGGHPQACGFTVKPGLLDEFIKSMRVSAKVLSEKELAKELIIDAEIPLDDVSWDLWDVLQKFEPFGEGNPEPVFLSKQVLIESVRVVGNTGKHMQVQVSHGSKKIHKTIAFGFAEEWSKKLSQGVKADIAYELSVNEWNGNRELQIKLVDMKKL